MVALFGVDFDRELYRLRIEDIRASVGDAAHAIATGIGSHGDLSEHRAETIPTPISTRSSRPYLYGDLFLNAVTFPRNNRTMSHDYDCLAEAEAAMKKAAAATCPDDRLKWVRIAEAWQDLGRSDALMIAIAPKVPSSAYARAGVTSVARGRFAST
jgi:hypothetical protein